MGRYFGTDGFRGEANVDLTAEHAYEIGRFLGWYYGKINSGAKSEYTPRVVIGKDTRKSSYMFEYALVAGLTASGADAYLLHVTTTPSVAYITGTEGFDCGIMISASHNPYFDNGIKLLNGFGEKTDDNTINLIESYLDGNLVYEGETVANLPYSKREQIGKTVDYIGGRNRYIAYLISLGIYSFRGYKIGLDCSNGSAWSIAKSVFDALGAETFVINASPDGVNINFNCGSTHIESLRAFVVENSLDVGFAFDGDADRCICVDEKGNVVTGDHILYICGKYMKEKGELGNNTVVTTVMSNYGLYKAFDAISVDYAKTDVGDRFVYEYMRRNGNTLGGEESGHIIFSRYATTGDGILTSLKLMEVMISKKLPMSKTYDGFFMYPQKLVNIKVKDKDAVLSDSEVLKAVEEAENELSGFGRVLVRKSGTEPVIRVMAEAKERETCQNVVDNLVELIRKKYANK